MGIIEYRLIIEERLLALDAALKATRQADDLYSSMFTVAALQNLRLARLCIETDLAQHERVEQEI
jgi:hypothetical protein